jgi:hypothetical protein
MLKAKFLEKTDLKKLSQICNWLHEPIWAGLQMTTNRLVLAELLI